MNYIEFGPVPASKNCSQMAWRSAYEPGLTWAFRRPCGAWFRVCANVPCPRQRLLTMASCVAPRSLFR